tara:strand:+ start:313 stop:768 length:456 start_codon:yes stop_codon:yes gene_type:complete
MFIEAELIFKYYNPNKIKSGMLFINDINIGHPEKENRKIWEITEDYFNKNISDDKIIEENGFPVRPFIVSDNLIITPDEIGTFILINEEEDEEVYIDFGITEMNFILKEFQGWLEVLIDEDTIDDEMIQPLYDSERKEDKVIIKFIEYDDD